MKVHFRTRGNFSKLKKHISHFCDFGVCPGQSGSEPFNLKVNCTCEAVIAEDNVTLSVDIIYERHETLNL